MLPYVWRTRKLFYNKRFMKHIIARDHQWNFSRSRQHSKRKARIYLRYKQSHMARKILKFNDARNYFLETTRAVI